jgi:hypothetical protein
MELGHTLVCVRSGCLEQDLSLSLQRRLLLNNSAYTHQRTQNAKTSHLCKNMNLTASQRI